MRQRAGVAPSVHPLQIYQLHNWLDLLKGRVSETGKVTMRVLLGTFPHGRKPQEGEKRHLSYHLPLEEIRQIEATDMDEELRNWTRALGVREKLGRVRREGTGWEGEGKGLNRRKSPI